MTNRADKFHTLVGVDTDLAKCGVSPRNLAVAFNPRLDPKRCFVHEKVHRGHGREYRRKNPMCTYCLVGLIHLAGPNLRRFALVIEDGVTPELMTMGKQLLIGTPTHAPPSYDCCGQEFFDVGHLVRLNSSEVRTAAASRVKPRIEDSSLMGYDGPFLLGADDDLDGDWTEEEKLDKIHEVVEYLQLIRHRCVGFISFPNQFTGGDI